MGGDYGLRTILAGVLSVLQRNNNLFIPYLCGSDSEIRNELAYLKATESIRTCCTIEHCSQAFSATVSKAKIWQELPNSSLVRCIALQAEGVVDASISCGETGALFASALFILGKLESVSRPALAAFLPTATGKQTLVVDVGANLASRPEHLVTFAQLGAAYVRSVKNNTAPTIGLLNIGTEPSKGPQEIREAHELLTAAVPGYIGFIEGSSVLSGAVDIVVTDGFCGNVLLKAAEGIFGLIKSVIPQDIAEPEKLFQALEVLNAEKYGAVPFLGIKGTVLKAHGSSSSQAIAAAIDLAISGSKGYQDTKLPPNIDKLERQI